MAINYREEAMQAYAPRRTEREKYERVFNARCRDAHRMFGKVRNQDLEHARKDAAYHLHAGDRVLHLDDDRHGKIIATSNAGFLGMAFTVVWDNGATSHMVYGSSLAPLWELDPDGMVPIQ